MDPNDPSHPLSRPATKVDLAMFAGDVVIALRDIQIALTMIRAGASDNLDVQVDKIGQHADNLWQQYKKLVKDSGV